MSVSVRAGELRQAIIVQVQSTSRNAYGEKDDTWTTLVTLPASVRPMFGREYVENKIAQSEVTHKIITRYYPDITTKQHRIVFNGRVLEIETLMNIEERNIMLEMLCVETDIET